jgi:putative aldouronate transport system substrate-binding protein
MYPDAMPVDRATRPRTRRVSSASSGTGEAATRRSPPGPGPNRRQFVSTLAASAAAIAGLGVGCRTHRHDGDSNPSEAAIAALLPRRRTIDLVPPDLPGEGPIPDGYLSYPARVVRAIEDKPARGGGPIKTMMPIWGPVPPGLGRNSYLDAVNAELGVTVDPSLQDGTRYAAKLSALLAARDIPDVLVTPSWEVVKIPRFSQAVKALFADLSEYLQGDSIYAYPRLATLPTASWRYAVWSGRLVAVPHPTDNPFPWALFYRKDLCDRAGVEAPRTIDELHAFGRRMTDPSRGVWAFGNIFDMVQMFFKCPNKQGGWRERPGGGLVHKYELAEYRQALEFTARLHREGMVHPEVIENNGADAQQLFNAGRLIAGQEGLAVWRASQSQQAKITPGFEIQPVPIFSAVGGEPLAWASDEPVFYTFIKKGLARERIDEILRVLDWCAAPFGSLERQLNQYGVEGRHFERLADGSPVLTDLGRKEYGNQYWYPSGRVPALVGTSDVPRLVSESLDYARATYAYREPDPFRGIRIDHPPNYARLTIPTEDKIRDIIRGRRPLSDIEVIAREWRRSGGDDGRRFFERALSARV